MLDATGQIKIVDFGVSRKIQAGKRMYEQCGTPAYIAPELIRDRKGYVGTACDLWSAGCCLYAMLVGNVPFRAQTMSELHQMIVNAAYSFDECQTKKPQRPFQKQPSRFDYSPEVRDLVAKLLTVEPHLRLTAAQALKHPWFDDLDQTQIEVYTEKEKSIILREYQRLNPAFKCQLDPDEVLFTEHRLETETSATNLPKNCQEKSHVLCPFNSYKSVDKDKHQLLGDIQIVPRGFLKFGKNVRAINRQYEEDNNADLDNGVINKARM